MHVLLIFCVTFICYFFMFAVATSFGVFETLAEPHQVGLKILMATISAVIAMVVYLAASD